VKDSVAYIYSRAVDADDAPIAMIVLEGGVLRFYAPEGSSMSNKAKSLTANALQLEPDEAEDYFDTYVDRWNGQSMHATVVALTGAAARKVEVTKAKWRKA